MDFESARAQFPALREKVFLDAACVSLAPRAATGIFKAVNSAFSLNRSCATSSAARGGLTAVTVSRGSKAAPAMFSQSKVSTSLRSASSASSTSSSRSPTRMGATCAPGASALRSKNRQRIPSG